MTAVYTIEATRKALKQLEESSKNLNSKYTIMVQGYIEGDPYEVSTSREFTLMSSVLGVPHLKLYEWYVQFIFENNFEQPNDEDCVRHIFEKMGLDYDSTPFEESDEFLFELPILYDGDSYVDVITSIILLDHGNGTFVEVRN